MRNILFICFIFSCVSVFSQNTQISPGVLWNDVNGEQINAHGGCVVDFSSCFSPFDIFFIIS